MRNILYYLAGILLLASCKKSSVQPEETMETEVAETVNANAAASSPMGNQQKLEFFGYVDVPPSSAFEVYAKAPGYISRIHVLEGTLVKKGAVLGQMESPVYAVWQKELMQAAAEWELQKSRYERLSGLHGKEAISNAEIEAALRDYKSAEADFKGRKRELEAMGFSTGSILLGDFQQYIDIRTSITGIVTEVHAANGQLASPSDHLFTIVDKSHLHIELQVPVADIGKIAIGDVFYFLPAGGTDTLKGEIHLINDAIESTTNTIRVHGHLEEEIHAEQLSVGERVFVTMAQKQ